MMAKAVRKIFTALAIIDDLGAIIIIAIFYVSDFSPLYLFSALGIFAGLLILNRLGVQWLSLYLTLGLIMWYFMLKSGVHATIAGVLLAFAIPFGSGDSQSPSHKLQHFLHKPWLFHHATFCPGEYRHFIVRKLDRRLGNIKRFGHFGRVVGRQAAGDCAVRSSSNQIGLVAPAKACILAAYNRRHFSWRYRLYHVDLHHTAGFRRSRSHSKFEDQYLAWFFIGRYDWVPDFEAANSKGIQKRLILMG